MPITKERKKEIIKDLSGRFSKAKDIMFLGFQGLTVKESSELRKRLRGENVDFKVAKKTLIKRGLKDAKIENADNLNLEGPVGVAVGYDDKISLAKLAYEYFKINNKLQILGGFISSEYMNADEVKALALLPTKEQLRAQLVGVISSPISGFVNVLEGNIKGLINTLKAISEKNNNLK